MTAVEAPPSILDTAGSEARQLADVWWLLFGLAAAVYVVVAAFIVVAVIRGRRGGPRPSRIGDHGFIWVGGIIVPVVILAVVAGVTVESTKGLRQPADDPLVVHVVGKRWWWAVDYPEQEVTTANEIRVPVDRPIEVVLDSDNVVHSFWVPQLAGKLDLVPGQTNTLRFTVEKEGVYRGECAEFCGIQHARMDFIVIAEPADEFERWMARRQAITATPDDELAAQGQRVFQREACAGCHTIDGTEAQGTVGPNLTDFGGRRWIGAMTVPNTPGHLRGWISNSQTIKPGNLMPPISLEPRELDAVVAYLESRK